MDIIDYLKKYKDHSFKQTPFNECDALILSMVSYFPFEKILNTKLIYNTGGLYKRLAAYTEQSKDQKKKDLHVLLKELCLSNRYKYATFCRFEKNKDDSSFKQFQAVTISLIDFTFISFGGTDSSVTGWREDLNMSFMDMVPSEEEAIRYINQVTRFSLFKKIMIGGHSKGGRLAIRAAKSLKNKSHLVAVYNFDGPNFNDDFYDDDYKMIEDKVHEYAPDESIIGRLFCFPPSITVIASNRHLLNQHNAFSWLIDDRHFVRQEGFSKRSNKIVNAINTSISKFDNEAKSAFVDALFDILDKLYLSDGTKAPSITTPLNDGIAGLRKKWKNIPQETRDALTKVLFTLIKDYIFG